MSTSTSIYCMKCKKQSPTLNPHIAVKSGRRVLTGHCAMCGSKKNRFVAGPGGSRPKNKKKGNGVFGNILGSLLPF